MRVITSMSGGVRSWTKSDVVPAGRFIERELNLPSVGMRLNRAPDIYPALNQLRDTFADALGFDVVEGKLVTPAPLTENALMIFKDAAHLLLLPGSQVEFGPAGEPADRKVVLDAHGVASMKYAQNRWVELAGVAELDVRGVLATDRSVEVQRAIRLARRVSLVVDGDEYILSHVEAEER